MAPPDAEMGSTLPVALTTEAPYTAPFCVPCAGCASSIASAARLAMRRAAAVLAVASFVGMLAAIGLYSWDLARHGTEPHLIAWFSAGALVLLTFPISVLGIVQHLSHWYMPGVQKYVVRILWMVPLYSVESWLSLRFHESSLYIQTVRDIYEAYCIHSFLYYLMELLGGERAILQSLRAKPPSATRHVWPIRLLLDSAGDGKKHEAGTEDDAGDAEAKDRPSEGLLRAGTNGRRRQLDRYFLHTCKMGCLQYVVIKVVLALMTCLLGGFEDQLALRPGSASLYIAVVANFSQTWALYCMILFYHCFKEDLAKWRPVGKFLCVKAVIFFTWWQAICIEILRANHVISSKDAGSDWTSEDIAGGLQDWLICVEMLLAAFAHRYSFTHLDYVPDNLEARRQTFIIAFLDSSLPKDVFWDLQRAAQGRLTESPLFSSASVCEDVIKELEDNGLDLNGRETMERKDEKR